MSLINVFRTNNNILVNLAKQKEVSFLMNEEHRKNILHMLPTLFLGAPIIYIFVIFPNEIISIIKKYEILFIFLSIPMLMLFFYYYPPSESNNKDNVKMHFFIAIFIPLGSLFLKNSLKDYPFWNALSIICFGYMISYIICQTCVHICRYIIKIIKKISNWLSYADNSINKSKFISMISVLISIFAVLQKFLDIIIKIVSLFNK